MAEVYSNNYNGTGGAAAGVGFDSRAIGVFYAPSGYGRGEELRKAGLVTIPASTTFGAIGDTVSLMDFKSGDRLTELLVSCDANQGAVTSDWSYGLYASSVTSIGAILSTNSDDMFATALDQAAALTQVDLLVNASTGTILDHHRGLTLWEMVNLVDAATYPSDPFETFTLAATSTDAAVITAASIHEWLVEARYVPGG
jgi:hypothetical protein